MLTTDRWITARESSRILGERGLSRQQSRRVLLGGLAGSGVRTTAAVLYDEARVRSLAGWPTLDHAELTASSAGGVVVVRLGPGCEPEAEWSWERRADTWRAQPDVGLFARIQVRGRIAAYGPLPCVITVCGFPVLTADLHDVRGGEQSHRPMALMELAPAGPWAGLLEERRLVTIPGPAWLLLGAQPYLGRAARAREAGEWRGAPRATTWNRWA
jgi:hypothetical protein